VRAMSIKKIAYAISLFLSVQCSALSQTTSIWNHNGSIVRLEASDTKRSIYYVEPRAGLPAKAGDLLFEGQRRGRSYEGTAFLFSQACGKIGYAVTGSIADDDRSVSMTGTAPRRNSQCQITSYFQDRLTFSFMRSENQEGGEKNNSQFGFDQSQFGRDQNLGQPQVAPFQQRQSGSTSQPQSPIVQESSQRERDQEKKNNADKAINWIIGFIIVLGVSFIIFPRFFKYYLVVGFPQAANIFGWNRAEIQIRENGKWRTVQDVDDLQSVVVYAFHHALDTYPGFEVRAVDGTGRISLSPVKSPEKGSTDIDPIPQPLDVINHSNKSSHLDRVNALKELHSLKTSGIINELEFEAQKKKILDS
jgi:hypothetical protein